MATRTAAAGSATRRAIARTTRLYRFWCAKPPATCTASASTFAGCCLPAFSAGGRASSQSSVHAIFHHMTEQFVMHRVPHSLFPSSHIFSSMTCSENGGFAYTKLPEHTRPRTFVRPTPDAIVQDNKCKVCCGLLPGLVMPEDVYLCEPARAPYLQCRTTLVPWGSTTWCCHACCPQPFPSRVRVLRNSVYPGQRARSERGEVSGGHHHRGLERGRAVCSDRATDTRCDQVVRLDNDGAVRHTAVGCHKIAPSSACCRN